ncbi:hypothetical protein B0H17DRAFT_1206285 [Mycena rosella]|uniref:Uncharacterized protein n=1 Tax=Mycena rosella TaxID=1033263 RepID=A0AAD7GD33_MYCRO|nr:hypothetical protein B0H17DRAFT_1206285 [Mycena rosella]
MARPSSSPPRATSGSCASPVPWAGGIPPAQRTGHVCRSGLEVCAPRGGGAAPQRRTSACRKLRCVSPAQQRLYAGVTGVVWCAGCCRMQSYGVRLSGNATLRRRRPQRDAPCIALRGFANALQRSRARMPSPFYSLRRGAHTQGAAPAFGSGSGAGANANTGGTRWGRSRRWVRVRAGRDALDSVPSHILCALCPSYL